jgi:energy-coupling factor transport system ATP-binding protein
MYEFRKSTPHHLSGGQKQRIAIAGIIAMQPECIILDEPTAMLDPVGRAEIIETLHNLNTKKNITVVLITHYMEEAENADRVMVMNDGVIIDDNTPKEIFKNVSQLKSVGLSVPQTTELLYSLNQNGFNISTDVLSIKETAKAIALCLEEK